MPLSRARNFHVIPGVVVVFEVLSRTPGRIDRIDKLREYGAVASILRYVILESISIGLAMGHRLTAELSRATFGPQLWKARHATGPTIKELAESAGTGWPHLSRIERGHVNVTVDTMHALAKAVGLNLHVTLRRPDRPKSKSSPYKAAKKIIR